MTLTWGSPPTDKTNQGPRVFLTVQVFLPKNMIRRFKTFSESTHKKTNKPGNKRASRVSLTRALATLNVASAELGDGKQVNSQIELF